MRASLAAWRGRLDEVTPKRPRDVNELARQIVDEATGEHTPEIEANGKDPAAVERGRKGGVQGGKARAHTLSPERRSEIARKAAEARWAKH